MTTYVAQRLALPTTLARLIGNPVQTEINPGRLVSQGTTADTVDTSRSNFGNSVDRDTA